MISLSHVKHNYNLGPVLEDFSMTVYQGERVGLIGANGSGKSTIFKLILGIETTKEGVVAVGRNIRVGHLSQIPDRTPGVTVEERLWHGVPELLHAERRMRELEGLMADATLSPEKMDEYVREYGELTADFEHRGGYRYESWMKQMVNGLGLTVPFSSEVQGLSGGELARLELAVLLLSEPDVLLLDEPTNHLDFSAIRWLEEYIKQFGGTALIISHDRYFLDQTVQRIVEVKNGEAEEYPGNYSYYLEERERRYELALQQYQDQQKEIKRKEEAIKRLRQWGKMSDDPRFFRKAANIQKQIERMEKIDRPDIGELKFDLDFTGDRSGKEVVTLKGVSKAYGSAPLFERVDLNIYYGQRIGLVGANGTGKTTLLRLILGQLEPDQGEVKVGASVQIGYFDQQQELSNLDATILDALIDAVPMPEVRARGILANYGFTGDEVFKQLKELSGGERSRFILLKMIYTQVNFLILDEPTNHFDLPSVEVLEESLKDYRGTLLVISHDRYFLNRVIGEIYALEDGKLNHYVGNYDFYQRKVQERKERSLTEEEASKNEKKARESKQPQPKDDEKEQRKLTAKRERELRDIEAEITRMEECLAVNYELMTKPECLNDYKRMQELQEENSKLEAKLQEMMQRWEELAV